MKNCPCCGQAVGDRPNPGAVIMGLTLRPTERRILSALCGRFGQWCRTEDVAAAIYSHRPDGGPLTANAVIRIFATRARAKIAGTGLVLDGKQWSGYRLRWESDEEARAA